MSLVGWVVSAGEIYIWHSLAEDLPLSQWVRVAKPQMKIDFTQSFIEDWPVNQYYQVAKNRDDEVIEARGVGWRDNISFYISPSGSGRRPFARHERKASFGRRRGSAGEINVVQ